MMKKLGLKIVIYTKANSQPTAPNHELFHRTPSDSISFALSEKFRTSNYYLRVASCSPASIIPETSPVIGLPTP